MSSKFFKNPLKVTPKQKDPRPMEQIQSEYMQVAVELGNIEYQIKTLEVQKGSCIAKMSELSLESVTNKPKEPSDGESSTSTAGVPNNPETR